MHSPAPLQRLTALLATENKQFLAIDLGTKSSCKTIERADIDALMHTDLVLFVDGKAFFENHAITATPKQKIICLRTIKKLIGKDIHAPVNVPAFNSAAHRTEFFSRAARESFDRIDALDMRFLAALECQVIPATIALQNTGLPFNQTQWRETLSQFESKLQRIKKELSSALPQDSGFQLFGSDPIDLNNATHVKHALELVLGKKLASTTQSTLKEYDHPVVKMLLEYRELTRMLSTYGTHFLQKLNGNRLRGTFTPIASASGRYACSDPNLLALPNHPAFQRCLEPDEKHCILRFDYGAFELRILAALSEDKTLTTIFSQDKDIHSMVAEAVFHQPVTKTQNSHLRDRAKVLNFGIIYGMKEHGLAKQLKISLHEAQELLHAYFARFSRVKEFLFDLEQHAQKNGFVSTALNRRCFVGHSQNSDPYHTARLARNMPIQGSGADIIKLAHCRVFKSLSERKLDAHIINVVHDELVIECAVSQKESVIDTVLSDMRTAFSTVLPNIAPSVSFK